MIFTSPVECLSEAFEFLEGPVWHREGYLLFSDIPASKIYKFENNAFTVWREESGHSNGLTFDWDGRLTACEHGNRRVSQTEPDGSITALADQYDGRKLNSPNDCVARSDGMVFFTDPPYGIEDAQKELSYHGVFKVRRGESPYPIVTDYDRPNGLAFTLDESHLYIADTAKEIVKIHQIDENGNVDEGHVFAKVGRPDGMKLDETGNLYVASNEGVVVLNPKGERLAVLEFPQRPANLAFGGEDFKTLFVMARTGFYTVQTSIAGSIPYLK